MRQRVHTCRRCGCTDDRACPDGCCWTHVRDVCSECLTSAEYVENAVELVHMRQTRQRWRYTIEFARYCVETGTRPTLQLARKYCPCSRADLNRALAHAVDEFTRRRAEMLERVLPC